MLYILFYFLLKGVTVTCVSNCVGWVVRTGRGRDRCWLCMRNTRCMVIAAWNVAMSGGGNWWVRSMKTPSLGNSACAKIGWLYYSPTQIRALILALITLLTRSVQILCSAIRCARACACAMLRVYMSYIPVTRSTGPLPS